MEEVTLKKIIVNKYTITVETGMHVGGIKDGVKIGGADNPVIKMPIIQGDNKQSRDVPYIPGSSIKGKIKSLLMSVYGVKERDKVGFETDSYYSKLFGEPANESADKPQQLIKTRLLFRDAHLSEKWLRNQEVELTEIKAENSINYITGRANPRFIERVVKGVEFDFEVVLSVFSADNEQEMLRILKEGIDLLENSYLGGNGSRGYGKVKISLRGEPTETLFSKDQSDHTVHLDSQGN